MISIRNRYFSFNRILLLAIGLWPYKQSKLIQLQLTLQYGILGSFIVFQFTAFAISKCDVKLVIEILSVASFFLNSMIMYFSFYFNLDVIRYSLELFQQIYDELKDEEEIAIIEKYWNIGKRYTEVFMLLGIFTTIFFTLSPFLLYVFDIAFSANKSRPYPSHMIITEYFNNQERYFYLIILYTDVAFCIGMFVIIATGTLFMIYMQHVCGMLKIASYRMKRIITIDITRMNDTRSVSLIHKSIIYAVDIHRNALKIVEIFVTSFNITFFFIILNGLLYASLNLYQVFQEISSVNISERLIQSFIFINVYYIYTFLCNDISQQVTDHNNSIFVTVYNVQWYIAPLHVQKLILFLLQRSTKTVQIYIGGLFKGSLECFVTLASATMSYFTFIYYTQ